MIASLQCLFQKPGVKSRFENGLDLVLGLVTFFLDAVFAMADKDKPMTCSHKRQFVNEACKYYLSGLITPGMLGPKATLFLLSAFFGFVSSPADAQVNLKTGYNFSILSDPGIDKIISSYNDLTGYSSGFRSLRWLHGFVAGLRFKSGFNAVELTYQGGYQALKAEGKNGVESYTDKLRFAIHSLAFGYQVSDRVWGLGADLQYQLYKTKFTAGLPVEDFTNWQRMFALKFYLMLTLKGRKGVDMALQPYYVLPFKEYDPDPLAQYLNVEPAASHDRWNRFGLTLLFYNGTK